MKSYPDSVEAEICVNPDGPPPAKRRKTERKPRTTEHLTLQSPQELSPHEEELLDQLTSALRKRKKIVVIAGAGISVSAGSAYSTTLTCLLHPLCIPECALAPC